MNKQQKVELRKMINWFVKEYERTKKQHVMYKTLYAPRVYREAMVERFIRELRQYVRKA